jgi:asparagine synthetase B (glutamine-hydrolysing)
VPYTDNDLVEFALSLPRTHWYAATGPDKPLLRSAFADLLPPQVLSRPKRAFHASFEKLFLTAEGRQEIANLRNCEALLEIFDRKALDVWMDHNISTGQWHGIWLLASLSRWMNRNIM